MRRNYRVLRMSFYIAEKKAQLDEFRAIPLQQKQTLYRNVRSIVAMMVKISKMTELYPVEDKVFDDFNENMEQNLSLIFNSMPFFTLTTKKVGFYYQEKKIKLFDEGERKFRSLFLVNGIREIYFSKGITKEEIRRFFHVISKTLNYVGVDYSFTTLLWDYNIQHIGTVSDPDMGEQELFTPHHFDVSNIAAQSQEFVDSENLFLGQIERGANPSDFAEFVERRGSGFVLGQYLQFASDFILKYPDDKKSFTFVRQLTSFPFDLLKEGEINSGIAFLQTVISLTQRFPKKTHMLYDRLSLALNKLGEETFVGEIFDLAELLTPDQYSSFAELVYLLGSRRFMTVFYLLVDIKIKEIRLQSLPRLGKYLVGTQAADRIFNDTNWHVVRNGLTLLTHAYNPEYLEYIRKLMTHEVAQVRLEAARVLSHYDADENLPYWQVAINSPDEDVRDLAMGNLVKVKGFEGKQVMNSVFTQEGFTKYGVEAFKRFTVIIIHSEKRTLFDLPINLLSHENKSLRMAVLSAFSEIRDPHMIYLQISRQLMLENLLKKDKDEATLLLGLVRGEQQMVMLKSLDYIFTLKAPFYQPKKYAAFKSMILMALITQPKRSNALTRWLQEGKKRGNSETQEILANVGN